MSSFRLDDLADPESVNGSRINTLQSQIPTSNRYKPPQTNGKISNNNLPYQPQNPNPQNFTYIQQPIQLIDFSHGFQINPKAIDYLNSIKDEIIIVSVIGKARTGKSYLMNLLLDLIGKGPGFQVASSLQSCTKGIWLWGTPKNSLNNNAKIVFLDSEGTSSTDKSTKTYDSRIFAVVVLISSLFLYNTYSNIDEHGISELSLAAHLSNSITTNSNIDKDKLITELSPKFIWIIRDFTLEKVHPETGEEISSKEYLELCLKNKRCGKNCNDNNVIRQNIIKFFPERDCVTLIRPVDSENDLRNLNNIPFNNLKPEFKMEFKMLKDKIYKEALPKKYNGKKLTGPTLATLIIEFVKVINSGKIPNINNTWDSVIEKDVSDSYNQSYDLFRKNIAQLNINQNNVFDQKDLLQKLYNFKYISLNKYDNILESGGDTYKHPNYKKLYLNTKNALITQMESTIQKIIAQNNSFSSVFCTTNLNNMYHPLEQRIYQNNFNSKNFLDINEQYSGILKKYDNIGKGPSKMETAINFMKNNEKNQIKYIKEMATKEGEKNMYKLDNNLKLAQADLDDMNNKQRVIDEKKKINSGKMQELERENKQLDSEVNELKNLLKTKKEQLNKIKMRNANARKNKQLLEEQKYKEKIKSEQQENLPESTETESYKINKDETLAKANKRRKNQDGAAKCECMIV